MILAQPRTLCRSHHPYAVPSTSLQYVCTRRRNCTEQLSPFRRYAPLTIHFLGLELRTRLEVRPLGLRMARRATNVRHAAGPLAVSRGRSRCSLIRYR